MYSLLPYLFYFCFVVTDTHSVFRAVISVHLFFVVIIVTAGLCCPDVFAAPATSGGRGGAEAGGGHVERQISNRILVEEVTSTNIKINIHIFFLYPVNKNNSNYGQESK